MAAIDYLPDGAVLYYDGASPETYTLRGTSLDDGNSGVREVEVQVNGGAWTLPTGTENWTFDWTPTGTGTYTINARATDYLDNTSANASITVTVTGTEPAAYITHPAEGASIFAGTVVDIIGTAKDTADFLNYQVQYKDTGDPDWTLITPTPVTTPVHEGLLAQWDTTGLDSPNYELQLTVQDALANITTYTVNAGILAALSMSGIADVTFFEEGQRYHYANLPDYVTPSDAADSYSYTILDPQPPAGMGVAIDGEKWLNIVPETDWYGWADVTVQADDGAGHTAFDTFRVTVSNLNDAPTEPVIELLPEQPGDTSELICSVIEHSTDPDGEAFQYTFDWYKSENGIQYGSVVRSYSEPADLVSSNSDSLSSLETTAGDWWRCVVRASDGTAYSDPVIVETRILQSSSITLSASPTSITLGEPVTLSGEISDVEGIAPVGFVSLSPDNLEDNLYPEGTVSNIAGAYSTVFYPKAATMGRDFWEVIASWPGDTSHMGAQSTWKSIGVDKADPILSLETSHASALLQLENAPDFSVTASLRVKNFPSELGDLFASQSIRLSVQDPNGRANALCAADQADGWVGGGGL